MTDGMLWDPTTRGTTSNWYTMLCTLVASIRISMSTLGWSICFRPSLYDGVIDDCDGGVAAAADDDDDDDEEEEEEEEEGGELIVSVS